LDGEQWHDPHPEGSGIVHIECVDVFFPLRGFVQPKE
jgi:hypothetical protein